MSATRPLIMLVEDSKLYQKYLSNICEKNDYDFTIANDGFEAVNKLFTTRPDLILLDVHLPKMDGYEVCEHIRRSPSINQTPIIFITSNNNEADIVKGFNLGGNDYVTKPFNEVILLSRIKSQLEQAKNKNLLNDYIFELEKINNELQKQKEHSEYLASSDHLTGIYNRRYIQSEIMESINLQGDASHFTLALFDIDNFKHVNDTYGHPCGDFVLKKVVELIGASQSEDDVLGRWGGEEFLLFMPRKTINEAHQAVDVMRQTIEDYTFNHCDQSFKLTITCGLSEYLNEEDYLSIFNRVDEALYDGKQTGKNKIVIK